MRWWSGRWARAAIHRDLLAYVRSVEENEWPSMAKMGTAHPATRAIYERLWSHTYTIEPSTRNQEAYLAEFLARMNELSAARRGRILFSRLQYPFSGDVRIGPEAFRDLREALLQRLAQG